MLQREIERLRMELQEIRERVRRITELLVKGA
jgi:hypothetical protein